MLMKYLSTGGVIDKSMVKDDDEEDISDEEVQARLQALMDENNAEKASMEQVYLHILLFFLYCPGNHIYRTIRKDTRI